MSNYKTITVNIDVYKRLQILSNELGVAKGKVIEQALENIDKSRNHDKQDLLNKITHLMKDIKESGQKYSNKDLDNLKVSW